VLYMACHIAFLTDMFVVLVHLGSVGRFLQRPSYVFEFVINLSGTIGLILGEGEYVKVARTCR
jgi:hypothetical protein